MSTELGNTSRDIATAFMAFLTATDLSRSKGEQPTPSTIIQESEEEKKPLAPESEPSPSVEQSKIPSSIKTTTTGIWTIYEHVPTWLDSIPGISIYRDMQSFYADLPFVKLLFQDLWSLGPLLVAVFVVSEIMDSVIPTLRLAQSASFLHMIEKTVTTRKIDQYEVGWTIGWQAFYTFIDWLNYECLCWSSPLLEQRYRYHFTQRMMSVRLHLDLPTSEEPDVKAKLSAVRGNYGGGKAWDAFQQLVKLVGLVLELTSTSSFIMGTMWKQPGGRTIVLLCFLNPLVCLFRERRWAKVFFGAITNRPYIRLDSLWEFSFGGSMKEEVLGNGMAEYVTKEYSKSRKELGDTYDGYPYSLHHTVFSPFGLLRDLTTDSALVLLGIKMMLDPDAIPLTSLAVLSQTSSNLSSTVRHLFNNGGSLIEAFNGVKAMYELDKIVNEVKDGQESYPSEGCSNHQGMEVEFKNVSFKYPHTDETVIDDLSFKLAPGALCVIVGENGCGKSSTLKLLNRLYDANSGEILIDGKPIKNYKVEDVRSASAFMYQNYQHYNFSISENIGFGNVTRMGDLEAIKEAARLGGADEFIQKLPNGYRSRTSEEGDTMMCGDVPEGSALDVMIKGRKDAAKAFSGGQTQRLALSRTFMRSTTCDVKLVAYDEPSAALDPKAEFELFERLRNLRNGKTMLFVTHRFGHLTKYADTIIYMESGKAVEQGSHEELLALNGKYARLYNVQAAAFSHDA